MHMVTPNLINRFKLEYLQIEDKQITPGSSNIPGGDFRKNLQCLFTLIDQNSEIYSAGISNNSKEVLDKLIEHNREKFGAPTQDYIKPEYMTCQYYNASIFFITHLEVFC